MNPQEIEKKILYFKQVLMKYRANLESLGYQFEYPDQVLREPDPQLEEKIVFLEKRIEPIPLTLKMLLAVSIFRDLIQIGKKLIKMQYGLSRLMPRS